MAKKENKGLKLPGWGLLLRTGTSVVVKASGRWARVLIIVFFVLVMIWQIYSKVIKSLQQEVPLPPNVEDRDPQLKVDVIKQINSLRSERVTHKISNYSVVNRILVPIEKSESE